jgi:hypothetical protein
MKFGKQAGVVVPTGQMRDPARRVDPGKVVNSYPVQYVAVEYGNEYGEVVKEIWLQVGEDFYRADDAEAFTANLRPVKDGHARQVLAQLAALRASSDDLPQTDAVDVVSKRTAAEATSPNVDV